jgi:hypothetical protein
LVDPDDIVEKMVYALSNPVKDRLVEKAHHWPGASSLDALQHGKKLTATRPRHFFRDDGDMPDDVSLEISPPRSFRHLTGEAFASLILDRIHDVEDKIASERSDSGTAIVGRRAVLAQKWSDRPATHEPRRALDPRVAARSKWSRIEALMRNRDFREAYGAARKAFIAGIRDVVFPVGTYWLRHFVQAICEPHVEATS